MSKYSRIYDYIKSLIISSQLKEGDKIPSVRKAAELFSVSITTIQNAYFDLQADGYIVALPKSGYYVTQIKEQNDKSGKITEKRQSVVYDFKSGDADKNSFDLNLWQRYIKSALRQKERLMSYSEVQGESDLRQALSDYIREKRNVIASPDRIVIGAGVQSLLNILCQLIEERSTVSFPDASFYQGIELFKSYGFDVHTRYKDARIIYVSPSHMTAYGDIMSVKRRFELVNYSHKMNSLVIEDDYDSDFLYSAKPTPSLYALSNGKNVIYMGSFSNVLIPGIRISYMVLTDSLLKKYEKEKNRFAQTASKTEQIALCQYIRDGHIKSQTRKVRRLYTTKAKMLFDEITKMLPESKCEISDNQLQLKVTVKYRGSTEDFEKNKIAVEINKFENGIITLILSPSAIEHDKICSAAVSLCDVIANGNKTPAQSAE